MHSPLIDQSIREDRRWALLLTLVAAIPRFAAMPIGSLNMHAARDIFRSLSLIAMKDIPLAGSELYFGGAVPGNFYFYLSAIPLVFWKSPYAVMGWIALLTSLAAGITYLGLRMVTGRMACAVACLCYAVFPLAIAENLWMWNPSYLPFFAAIALWGLCYWLKKRSGTGLAVMLTAGLLGIQVHLSAYAFFVSGILTLMAMIAWRARGNNSAEGARGATTLHVLLPFIIALPFALPFLWLQGKYLFIPLRLKMAGPPGIGLLDPHVNIYAFSTIAKAFVFMDDTLARQEFLNFQRFLSQLAMISPPWGKFCAVAAPIISIIGHAPFAIAGFFICIVAGFFPAGMRRKRLLALATIDESCARPLAFALVLWFLIPSLVLVKTLGIDAKNPLGIPTRYVVIFFPLAMVFMGFGFAAFYNALRRWKVARMLPVIALAATLATHAVLLGLFDWVCMETAGVFKATLPLNDTKPLFVEKRLCDFLAKKHGVTLLDFRERFFTDSNFMDLHGEQFLNFELWEGAGENRPGAPANHWFYLYDTNRNLLPPRLIRESGPVIDEINVRQFRLIVIDRKDSAQPVTWPKGMLETPMMY